MIERESERLRLITDQLLASAHLDRGELRLRDEVVDTGELCGELISSATLHAPPTIAFALERPAAPVHVHGDRERLRQVLANLLDNAIKYSPQGGRISVRTSVSGATGTIEVADEGLGVPAEEHDRIFDKFYRLDPSMTKGVGGSGLGLYISREFVRQMGGTLTLESQLGHGSTFRIKLPAA